MATIANAIQISNGTANTLNSINKSINIVVNNFKMLNVESSRAINTSSISAAATKLSMVAESFSNIKSGISAATEKMKTLNGSVQAGKGSASGFAEKVKGIASSGWPALKAGMALSDNYVRQSSQLASITGKGESQALVQDKVFAAAQNSRSSYDGTLSTVTKLRTLSEDDFKTTDESIYFTELLNKSFSGVDSSTAAGGIDQITEAMISGKLQGDDLMSVMEKAPMLAKAISKYTRKSPEELMAGDGVSDDVIKNSLYNSANDINNKVANTPETFQQVFDSVKNTALDALQPVLDIVSKIAGVIIGNWSWIEPIIWGIIAALIVYNATMGIAWLTTMKNMAANILNGIASGIETVQIIAMTLAQDGLNAALALCPIAWIIIAIIALIAIFYAVIAAINHFAGTSLSATGIIMGVFATVGAFIANIFLGLLQIVFGIIEYWYNLFASFANFFGNLFNDPIGAIINLFGDLADNVLGVLEKIASAMDFIFGTHMADTVKGWRADLKVMAETGVKEYGNGTYKDRVSELDINSTLSGLGINMNRLNYGDAYKAGYGSGKNIEGKFDLSKLTGGATKAFDATKYSEDQNLKNNVATAAANTGAMKNSMDVSEEDLKYMRDVAEQEVINRFTTSEIKVDMTNNNNINSNLDLDGVVSYMEQKVNESLMISAEGAHN